MTASDTVITLIANPKKAPLTQAFVDSMAVSLATQGVTLHRAQWLAAGIACDLFVPNGGLEALNALVWRIIEDQPYDAVAQAVANRRRKLLISDMDSTMITAECIDELADFIGRKAEVAEITERAMNGELDFAQALMRRVALLEGLPETILQQCYDERIRPMGGAERLVSFMRAQGAYTVLVSGGFTFFTSRVRRALGFDEDHANRLEIRDGLLTGRVIAPILGKEAKLQSLKDTCKKLGIGAADALAVGDGANDLPMLLAAGLGVAYHAKPVVRAQAQARLTHCDLSALLYAQGYGGGGVEG